MTATEAAMQPFVLHSVPELRFGIGEAASAGACATALAGGSARVLLVADTALDAAGITGRVREALGRDGHAVELYDAIAGEPKADVVDAGASLARTARAQMVVGLGGGSALDAAKLIACAAAAEGPVETYQLCAAPLPSRPLPCLAIPTTAGTGSEVTSTAIFTNSRGVKVWAWGQELKPRLAILDPELTVGLPPALTAATGLDALVHAIEATTNRRAFAANDVWCHAAIRLIAANLERAVAAPDDLDARAGMLLGSTYAGIGIENAGTAIAHNIAHALAALVPIHHGRATAIGMAASIGWALPGNPARFAAVAEAMGRPARPEEAVAGYFDLVEAIGLDLSPGSAGQGVLPDLLAEQMTAPENAPMRTATAREVTDEALAMLARQTCALGTRMPAEQP